MSFINCLIIQYICFAIKKLEPKNVKFKKNTQCQKQLALILNQNYTCEFNYFLNQLLIQMNSEDIPITDAFYQNPLQYMQNYVRGLNNEIFLSEYHINNLYALLLIGRNSPWDNIKGNNQRIREDIDVVVNQKVQDVKAILQSLSNMYEDKTKKSAISQIEKLMSILKSKKKSIFIEKDKNSQSFRNMHILNQLANEQRLKDKEVKWQNEQHYEGKQSKDDHKIQQESKQQNDSKNVDEPAKHPQKRQTQMKQQNHTQQQYQQSPQHLQKDLSPENGIESQNHHVCPLHQEEIHTEQQKKPVKSISRGGKQVFNIFYGLANLSSLSALALTNILQYNSSERFIKFKMSQNYNMTIKNEDPLHFDIVSQLSKIPSQLFINHVFPYLTAAQLFGIRHVCKEWLQHVKESWHATFKRQMFVQLLACQFCKDIEFFYKTIQLRNPFFQKLSLLIHALIEIIQWENVYQAIASNSLNLQLKRILIIILRLIGQPIELTNLSAINDAFFQLHKEKLMNLKQKVTQFFSTLSGSDLTINDLRNIKTNFLDDPFMRVEQINSQDKSPLLLTLFAKQMTLQQILRNHIFLCQQYLLNTKKRLDHISKKMVYQKGYLEGVYKILLLKSSVQLPNDDKDQSEMPNFQNMLQSIFTNRNSDKPDFVIKNRASSTEIFLDNATKLDLILTTVYNLDENSNSENTSKRQSNQEHQEQAQKQQEQSEEQCQVQMTNRQNKNQIINSIDLKIQCIASQQNQQSSTKGNKDQNQSKENSNNTKYE